MLICPVCEKAVPELTTDLDDRFGAQMVGHIVVIKPFWTIESGLCASCHSFFWRQAARPGRCRVLWKWIRDACARVLRGS